MKDIQPNIENKIEKLEWDWHNEHHTKLNLEPVYVGTEFQFGFMWDIVWESRNNLRRIIRNYQIS